MPGGVKTQHQAEVRSAIDRLRGYLQAAGLPGARTRPTQELLADLDLTFRAALDVQRALARLLGIAAQDGDLYLLAARVYRGLPQDSLCGTCLSVVPSAGACPFCGEELGEAVTPDGAGGPIVPYETSEIVGEAVVRQAAENRGAATPLAPPPPTISPGKAVGPKEKAVVHVPRRGRMNKKARKLAQWARRVENCKLFPFTRQQLLAMHRNDRRSVAAAVLDDENRDKSRHLIRMPDMQLVEWILGNQPPGPKDPGSPPVARPAAKGGKS